MSWFAEPTLVLLMYIKFSHILINFLSTPLSIRILLFLRSADSVILSAIDMKGFKDTLYIGEVFGVCWRELAMSQERVNLTIRGLVLCSEYLPILEQSHNIVAKLFIYRFDSLKQG